MLRPRDASGSDPLESPELLAPHVELLEQPLNVRMVQIATGILIFLLVSRWGARILILLIGSNARVATPGQAIYLAVYTCLIYIAAALAGGAVAGAWSVNWIPQGIGVGFGVLIVPLMLLLFFLPESLPFYFIGVVATTGLTVLGAYVGHLLVRPAQFLR
jgi:hypothetical protein